MHHLHSNEEHLETNVNDAACHLARFSISDNRPGTGVDDISHTVENLPGSGYQDLPWIMAPCCGTITLGGITFPMTNDVNVHIGNSIPGAMEMACTDATATPAVIGAISGLGPIPTSWKGTGEGSSDQTPVFKFGTGADQISAVLPVRVKVMKKRTVNVICYMVRKAGSGSGAITTCGKEHLEATLNRIFGSQITAWFNVVVKQPDVYEVDFDLNENGWVDPIAATTLGTGVEAARIISEVPQDPSGDIHVYFMNYHVGISTTPPRLPGSEESSGILAATPIDANHIFVSPRVFPYTDVEMTRVIAHEVGHVLVGPGHPDTEGGLAPLKGTNRLERLMYTMIQDKMAAGALDKNLLVKTEWDKAEAWLSGNIDNKNP